MKRLEFILAGAVIVVAPAMAVRAHPGPRVWVNLQAQQVATWQGPYPPGDPASYSPGRVFSQPLIDDADVWSTDFPGFQRVPGGNVPAGTNFSYDIAGPLLFYEPAASGHGARFRIVARHFGAVSSPQMAVTNELFQTKVTADGAVGGDLAFAYNGGDGDHNHLTYTLLADGATAGGGADGIYVLSLRLTSPGVTPSEPYFLLLGKNAPTGQITDAATLAGNTLVLPGDANGDGVVNFPDFQSLERSFGNTDAGWDQGDFNADGLVNYADFLVLQQNFGRRRDGSAAPAGVVPEVVQVPEPTAPVIVASIAMLLFSNRPRRLS